MRRSRWQASCRDDFDDAITDGGRDCRDQCAASGRDAVAAGRPAVRVRHARGRRCARRRGLPAVARRVFSLGDRERRRDAGIGSVGMRDHCRRHGRARGSCRHHPERGSRDEHRRERDLLAAGHRRRARARQHPQRDLPRQYLDRAPLSDDAAPALAGSGEDAGHGRQFCDAAGALAHRRRILAPHAS